MTTLTEAHIAAIAGCLERLFIGVGDIMPDGFWQLEDAAWVLRSWNDVAQYIAEAIADVEVTA